MILKVISSGPLDTNAYVIGCSKTKKGAVIDAPPNSAELIISQAMESGLDLEKILLTHSHWDHIADVAFLRAKLRIPVYIHSLDARNIESPGSDGLSSFVDIESVKPDGYLEDGQVIEVGALRLEVIHTPGHSPGGVCFYLEEQKKLISGDTLFRGTMGRVDLVTSDAEKMWMSLEKLSKLPPETEVYPGHGPSTTISKEKWIANAKERFE